MRIIRPLAVLTVAMALAVSGCSNQAPESKDGKSSQGGAEGSKGGATKGDLTIAVVTHAKSGDTFWDVVKTGAEDAGKEIGVKVTYAGKDTPEEQSQLIDNAVAQKVDGIAVSMANPGGVRASIEKAVKAGIPVITINSGLEQSKEYGAITHIGQSESIAGEAAGEKLKAAGVKNVVCVIHEQGNIGLQQRCDGASKGLGVKLTPLQVDVANLGEAQTTIKSRLQSDQKIDGILTLNPAVAKVAVQAKKEANSEAKLGTFDVSADLCDQIAAGEVLFSVDQQQYLQGYLAVVMLALKDRNGNDVGGGRPVYSGPGFITKENAEQVKKFAQNGTR